MFLSHIDLDANCYVYMDPPYLISGSEYNKLWNADEEYALCDTLDGLDREGIRFGVTNLVRHKGAVNTVFATWAAKYFSYIIKSNYISFNDNTIKDDSMEMFVTNVSVRQENKYIADLSLGAADCAYNKQEEFCFV